MSKILIADDNMTAQNAGRKILLEAGYDVVAVSNGAAALKKIASEGPDLLVLDVFMPGYSGVEICEKIKAEQNVPVLLTFSRMEPFRPDDARRVQADGVVVKPFDASELAAAVAGALSARPPKPEIAGPETTIQEATAVETAPPQPSPQAVEPGQAEEPAIEGGDSVFDWERADLGLQPGAAMAAEELDNPLAALMESEDAPADGVADAAEDEGFAALLQPRRPGAEFAATALDEVPPADTAEPLPGTLKGPPAAGSQSWWTPELVSEPEAAPEVGIALAEQSREQPGTEAVSVAMDTPEPLEPEAALGPAPAPNANCTPSAAEVSDCIERVLGRFKNLLVAEVMRELSEG
ncbi:MAG: response regulator [Acidobacteria bacterium]|nr:response regulator [Acidobacteriota bacterium]